jgi:hypothetical protein
VRLRGLDGAIDFSKAAEAPPPPAGADVKQLEPQHSFTDPEMFPACVGLAWTDTEQVPPFAVTVGQEPDKTRTEG